MIQNAGKLSGKQLFRLGLMFHGGLYALSWVPILWHPTDPLSQSIPYFVPFMAGAFAWLLHHTTQYRLRILCRRSCGDGGRETLLQSDGRTGPLIVMAAMIMFVGTALVRAAEIPVTKNPYGPNHLPTSTPEGGKMKVGGHLIFPLNHVLYFYPDMGARKEWKWMLVYMETREGAMFVDGKPVRMKSVKLPHGLPAQGVIVREGSITVEQLKKLTAKQAADPDLFNTKIPLSSNRIRTPGNRIEEAA